MDVTKFIAMLEFLDLLDCTNTVQIKYIGLEKLSIITQFDYRQIIN